jgi:cullin 3
MGGGAEAVERVLEGDRFLKAVKGVWEDHTGSMRKLKDVLKYMASCYNHPSRQTSRG